MLLPPLHPRQSEANTRAQPRTYLSTLTPSPYSPNQGMAPSAISGSLGVRGHFGKNRATLPRVLTPSPGFLAAAHWEEERAESSGSHNPSP